MQQAHLDLDSLSADHSDRVGFELGWDHAHHGLVPAVELMLDGTPLRQGWSAGRAVFGSRTLAASRAVRQWLALRTDAWRQGLPFEGVQLTPNYLAQLEASHCPVTLRALGGIEADAAVLQRLRPQAGYSAGALAVLSAQAAAALAALDPSRAVQEAWANGCRAQGPQTCAQTSTPEVNQPGAGLDATAWQRLAVLLSFVTPLPHAEAARMPLLVMPPNRVRVLNAVQGLQVVLTWQLASPGWSARLREVATMIEDAAVRHEFMLFVGALAPRVMELPDSGTPAQLRQALGTLWQDVRVQRRWTLFALALGEAAAEHLATRMASLRLRGRRVMVHATRGATEGWAAGAAGAAPAAGALQAGKRSRVVRRGDGGGLGPGLAAVR